MSPARTVERLLRQQAAIAQFGSFASIETDLAKILAEAARICAESLDVPFAKICRYRSEQNDLHVVAGYGWRANIVGHVISKADSTSTQGRAFVTGEPIILKDIRNKNSYCAPAFYADHGIVSTVDVLIKGANGSFGVLEADCKVPRKFDRHDINFMREFANVIAEVAGATERSMSLQSALDQMRLLSEERSVLAAELQHRVRNNLQLVYGMLVNQIELSNAEDKEGMRAIARRVMTLAKIYDHLLGHGLVQSIDFGAYLKSLCLSLEDFQEKRAFDVTLVCSTDPMTLDLDTVTALGIVVTEIVSNAYLHAFPAMAGTIRVALSHLAETGTLTISDDGIGFTPPETSRRHGVGLVRRLMEQANGTADVVADRGTTWTLKFPSTRLLPVARDG